MFSASRALLRIMLIQFSLKYYQTIAKNFALQNLSFYVSEHFSRLCSNLRLF